MDMSNWDIVMLSVSSMILISFLPILHNEFKEVKRVADKGDIDQNKGEIK